MIESQADADGFPGAGAALCAQDTPLLLLLDGLDEVRDEGTRQRLCAWLAKHALALRGRWRFVVTSRYATWERESRLSDEHFLTADVLGLPETTIREYVRRWFTAEKRRARLSKEAAPHRAERDALSQADRLIEELRASKSAGDRHLTTLMSNPLSLALLCQVHTRHAELPTRRSKLYEACLDIFLQRRPTQQERPALPSDSARAVLQPLAWWMQSHAVDDLPRRRIERLVAAALVHEPDLASVTPAAFVTTAWKECGVLSSRDFQTLGFFHAALREYLAASYAVERRKFSQLVEHAGDARWRNVILLAMSLRRGFSGVSRAMLASGRLAQHLDELRDGLRQAISIEIKPFVAALGGALAEPARTSTEDVLAILRLFEGRKEPKLWAAARGLNKHADERVQRAAAQALALVEPTPRARQVQVRPESKPGELWREPATGITFVWIPPGEFLMGKPPGVKVKLTQGFWIGQDPVTNEVYGRFLAAAKHREPEYWRNARFNKPDQPVVGVDWHDAMAFCAWATKDAAFDDEREITLPTEAQWEYVARAAGGERLREYPWGDEAPTPKRAVFGGADLASIGGRPAGATPLGVHDLAGNVWEWCLDEWKKSLRGGDDPFAKASPESAAPRVLRGGSWSNRPGSLRAAVRSLWRPESRSQLVGFRVVCVCSRQHA